MKHGVPSMSTALFKCPSTGTPVQCWFPNDVERDDDTQMPTICIACGRWHLIMPTTGQIVETAPSCLQPRLAGLGSPTRPTCCPQRRAPRPLPDHSEPSRLVVSHCQVW